MFKKIIAVFILLISPTMALSHSPLKLSNPMDGASLSKAPTEYKMLFKSPAKLIKFEIFKKGKNDNKETSLLKSLFKNSENYDFIINISEDGWFGESICIDQHFFHSIFRSIEEGKNVIRSANNGTSAYVDSKGQIIKKIESTQKGVIEIDSYKKGSKTIFSSYGNKIFFYFLIFYITVIFLLKIRERQ